MDTRSNVFIYWDKVKGETMIAAEIRNKLGTAPIPSLIITLSVPLYGFMFVLSLYNI